MASVFQFFNSTPTLIAFFGAYNVIFALIGYISIVRQLSIRKIGFPWLVLICGLGACMLSEWFQLEMQFKGKSFSEYPLWGLSRYFGAIAPLMWILAAKMFADLVQSRRFRYFGVLLMIVVFGWNAYQSYVVELPACCRTSVRADVLFAAAKAAKVIKADYRGPKRQKVRKVSDCEYYSTRRPVVFSAFSALAWFVRGQSEGAEVGCGMCPYQDDYLFIRVGSGYGKIDEVDSKVYDFVCSIQGLGTEWRLFRRKSTENSGIMIRGRML